MTLAILVSLGAGWLVYRSASQDADLAAEGAEGAPQAVEIVPV